MFHNVCVKDGEAVFSVLDFCPVCPPAMVGGGPDVISGVYCPAGCCEAPPKPLIRILPGRPHCLPDTSVLITQPGPITEGGRPSA